MSNEPGLTSTRKVTFENFGTSATGGPLTLVEMERQFTAWLRECYAQGAPDNANAGCASTAGMLSDLRFRLVAEWQADEDHEPAARGARPVPATGHWLGHLAPEVQ